MQLYRCDVKDCNTQIDTQAFFCEVVVNELVSILLQGSPKGQPGQKTVDTNKYHLCPSHWKEVRKLLNFRYAKAKEIRN